MAQKKRKEPEVKEEYNFVPPDFNEREFLEKDMAVTKTVLFSSIIAVVLGVVAYLTTDISFVIGLLIILLGAVLLRNIFKTLPVDISSVETKTWIGNGVMTFFFALGIWILLLNPPFGDSVDPEFSDFAAWNGDTLIAEDDTSLTIVGGTQVTFNVTVIDNNAISTVEYKLSAVNQSSSTVVSTGYLNETDEDRYEFVWTFVDSSSAANYVFEITATDEAGNTQVMSGSVLVP
ncbi:MAG: hypothetical protein LUQ09_07385 [Methanomassiliicoccales archaeon]|nr:hypothetical protein [Methanomassiliicoccales archaeon]